MELGKSNQVWILLKLHLQPIFSSWLVGGHKTPVVERANSKGKYVFKSVLFCIHNDWHTAEIFKKCMKRENEWSLRKQIANRSKSKGNPDIGISKNFIVVIIYVLKKEKMWIK